jgi:hypothetical protein
MYTRARTFPAGGTGPASPAARRPGLRATVRISVLSLIGAGALGGCGPARVAATGAATPASSAASSSPGTPATTPAQPAPPGPTPAQTASAPPPAPVTLGQLAGLFARGSGFGQVRPARIFNGGDPTGLVTNIAWRSWGRARAVGTGTGEYVGPSQSVATGTDEAVTVVAFRLGTCEGKRMYRAVEWYFPQHGQAFDPGRYEDICTGRYVPGP